MMNRFCHIRRFLSCSWEELFLWRTFFFCDGGRAVIVMERWNDRGRWVCVKFEDF